MQQNRSKGLPSTQPTLNTCQVGEERILCSTIEHPFDVLLYAVVAPFGAVGAPFGAVGASFGKDVALLDASTPHRPW